MRSWRRGNSDSLSEGEEQGIKEGQMDGRWRMEEKSEGLREERGEERKSD